MLIAYGKSTCGDDTAYMSLAIDTVPDISFDILPNDTVCINSITSFAAQNNNGTTVADWLWDFGDGNTSTLQNPDHTYLTALGDINVQLIATSNHGCNDTLVKAIRIEDPAIDFGMSIEPACIGDTVWFNSNATATYTDWNWDFGDTQTGTGRSLYHIFTYADTFEVTLTVCSKTLVKQLIVHPPSQASAGSPEHICQGYAWNFANSAILPDTLFADSLLWTGGLGSFDDPKALLPIYTPATGEQGPVTLQRGGLFQGPL